MSSDTTIEILYYNCETTQTEQIETLHDPHDTFHEIHQTVNELLEPIQQDQNSLFLDNTTRRK